tara:strand:- start:746 stop:2131 length:1386 start_codon:yes stop_codon:yes gene_type:complete
MNINITRSSYINKNHKTVIIFDCIENKYRKKISSGIQADKNIFKKGKIDPNTDFPMSISLGITLEKIRQKRDEALLKYKENKWTHLDLEQFLNSGINIYSIEEYVRNVISESRNKITANDYLNVVKAFKKHLKKNNIHFKDILEKANLYKFKLNAQRNGIKSSSLNSYLKKMGVIMNKAYRDGFLSEKFNIPKYLLEQRFQTEKKIDFNKNDLIYSINSCDDIYQVQSLSVFVLLMCCGGMNPSDLMNYKLVKKEDKKSLISSILFDYKNDYIKFKKSKKGDTYKYVKLCFRLKKIIEIVKSLYLITHYKKYPFILSSYTNENMIFKFDIYNKSNTYKNLWNFNQKKLREVYSIKFSDAKILYQKVLEEIEMTKSISDIMFANIKEVDILKLKNISEIKEKTDKAGQEVLRKIGIDEITQVIINRLKFLNLDLNNFSFKYCKTPIEFTKIMRKINTYHRGL